MAGPLDNEMKELLDSFLVETQEILDTLDQDLMQLESQAENFDLLNSVFRSFHTIKGTSSFMGFDQITEITHHAEDILNKLRKAELRVTSDIVDALLEVYDWLKILLKKAQAGDTEPVDYSKTMQKLHKIIHPESSTPAPTPSSPPTTTVAPTTASTPSIPPSGTSIVEAILSDKSFGTTGDYFTDEELAMIAKAFDEINRSMQSGSRQSTSAQDTQVSSQPLSAQHVQTTQPSIAPSPLPSSQLPASAPAPLPTTTPIAARSSEHPSAAKKAPTKEAASVPANAPDDKKAVAAATETTIRVDINRLETLMDLSGELVLGRNRLAQVTQELIQRYENHDFLRELQETSSAIDFITTELQSAIMKTRMVPISKIFQKAPRIVRDLSKEFGKEIELVLRGEETELDRGIIEELNDPLVHMIRNSCDHGIERPEEREKVGKSRKGTLILDAQHEGNHIVVSIIDDGKGIDPEMLKRKALEKGLITSEQAQTMTDRDAYSLIFMPGFSTAEKVTSVSGRGVGMDVVRTNIQKLKGIIEVDSKIGSGTTFTIKLPLTLAIIQGLLVRVQSEIYALPLSAVVEVVNTDLNQIYSINQNEVIRIRNQVFPLIRMDKILKTPTVEESLENRYVVVVGLADKRLGLVVDELLGQKEIVIKSLGEYLGHIRGMSGSTILGDGRVIMILDIEELIQASHHTIAASVWQQ
ncbi:MAG: chemotaxis protein CheA [Bacteroidota bacterium]|nr:chemotaxis protein CheA [Candidatus Kapabacteria bacterium]MDW8219413.1 chemotaxis protein CheA [Bacteroidota bacterium]